MLIKSFKIFESLYGTGSGRLLESEIDLNTLEDILIDFKQMGLENDISIGSSIILDFDKLNKEREEGLISGGNISIHSGHIDLYKKSQGTDNSLTIDLFKESQISEINIDDFEDGYNMLTSYLKEEYNLIPNYIYVNHHWNYQYFENVKMLRLEWFGGHLGNDPNRGWHHGKIQDGSKHFKAHKITIGYYRN
jgi:hypothetical protein